MNALLGAAARAFDRLSEGWEHFIHRGAMGAVLVASFLASLVVIELRRQELLPEPFAAMVTANHFGAVNVAFTLLLFVEIIALVFALAHSVADSIGKQFELFSLILLRKAFLEFGEFGEPVQWSQASDTVLVALADIVGALLVFVIVGYFYRLQHHRPITASERDQAQFVRTKKLIALSLLAIFVGVGILDGRLLLDGERTFDLFHTFYTILIFSDILIVLVALSYSADYRVVFRNSGFAAATIVLRLALVSPPFINALLGTGAALLVVGLSMAYNGFVGAEERRSAALLTR